MYMELTTVQRPRQELFVRETADSTAGAVTPDQLLKTLPTVQLKGATLHAITEAECGEVVMDELAAGRGGWIITMNLDHLRRFTRDETYRPLCARATLHVADGMPLIWASRFKGSALPERVTGSNLILSLSQLAADNGRSIFLLGGQPGTAQTAANTLQERIPNLRVAGTYCPEIGFENHPDRMHAVIEAVVAAQPDIVYIALGSPKQDILIERLRQKHPSAWWLGVGISFSFLAGEVSRAPQWMQTAGLEWLHRLSQEPRRLASRYLIQGMPFAAGLMLGSLFQRLTPKS